MDAKKTEARLNIRLDPQLKAKATAVAEDMGIDLSTVVRLTLTQMVKDRQLPFMPTSLPVDTLEALHDANHPDRLNQYASAEDMWGKLGV